MVSVFTPGDITSKTTFTTDGDTSTSSITGTVTHLLSLPLTVAAEMVKDQILQLTMLVIVILIHTGLDAVEMYIQTSTGDAKFGRSSITFTRFR